MRRKNQRTKASEKPERLELEIAGLGAAGDGYAMAGETRVYVPRTVPGDHVRVDRRGARAELVELLSPGPSRVAPDCPHYDQCGGCQLQHLEKTAYREHKIRSLVTTLERAGLSLPELEAHWCGPGGRRRATLRARGRKASALLGYQMAGTHKLVDISSCLVMEPDLEVALPHMRTLAQRVLAPGEEAQFKLTRFDNGLEVSIEMDDALFEDKRLEILSELAGLSGLYGFTGITVNDEPALRTAPPVVKFDGFEVSPPHDAFLQPSREGEAVLTDFALRHRPEVRTGKAIDLFAGCGTYTLPLSRHFDMEAFESSPAQVEAITNACKKNMVPNVKATRRDLYHAPLSGKELKGVDYALLNPPRAGAREQAEALATSSVPVVTYISCNPGTLARDAAVLVEGGYRLSALTLVDQFVFAAHSECVAVFEKPE